MFQEAFRQLGQIILQGSHLQAVDVGGARCLIPHWQKFLGNTDFYMYEPHEQSYEALAKMYEGTPFKKDFHIVKTALASTNGLRSFYCTNAPTGSSLLKPRTDDERYANDPYFVPVREILIRTQRLEDSLEEEGAGTIDAIKLDVQGGEMEVLTGLDEHRLNNLLCVELEVNLSECYHNSPTIGSVQAFMEAHGLELFDIRASRGTRMILGAKQSYNEAAFGVPANSASVAARLAEVDMVFFRKPSSIAQINKSIALRKMIFTLCVYNYFSDAFALLNEGPAKNMLPEAERVEVLSVVKTWQGLNQQLMQGYEQTLQTVGYQVWGQYTWVPFPCS